MGLLLSHQMAPSVVASRTMNLSCTERPVWTPVSTDRAPAEEKCPSPPAIASSTSSASLVLRLALARREEIVMCRPCCVYGEQGCACHAVTKAAKPGFFGPLWKKRRSEFTQIGRPSVSQL